MLVGTTSEIDGKLPDNIISVHRTANQKELAEIYTAADVFVNPTREDTFPTVNIEALACGVPVVTFDTGGSAEILDKTCGRVIEKTMQKRLNAQLRIFVQARILLPVKTAFSARRILIKTINSPNILICMGKRCK